MEILSAVEIPLSNAAFDYRVKFAHNGKFYETTIRATPSKIGGKEIRVLTFPNSDDHLVMREGVDTRELFPAIKAFLAKPQ